MSEHHRIFFEPESEGDLVGSHQPIRESDLHHLQHVLRLKDDEIFTAISRRDGRSFHAKISTNTVSQIVIVNELAPKASPTIVQSLSFALCKSKRTDLVCEKACELGVDQLLIFQAERSIVRLKSENEAKKRLDRLARVAEAAAKQCKRDRLPKIYFFNNITELLSELNIISSQLDHKLCCSLLPEAIPLRDLEPPAGAAHLLIGPEGDLTDRENNLLRESGFSFVTLGPNTLRAETAAIAGIAVAQGLWNTG